MENAHAISPFSLRLCFCKFVVCRQLISCPCMLVSAENCLGTMNGVFDVPYSLRCEVDIIFCIKTLERNTLHQCIPVAVVNPADYCVR